MKRILLLSIILAMVSCQKNEQIDLSQLSPKEREAVTALGWLRKADADRDAADSIQRGDLRLLAMASRGPNMPGVPAESASKAKSVCGIRYLEGSTDAVAGEVHMQLLQQAFDYAVKYNKLLLEACLNRNP